MFKNYSKCFIVLYLFDFEIYKLKAIKELDLDLEEIGGHFEGDMILSDKQIDIINRFADKNGLKDINRRWHNNVVPYVIDMNLYDADQIDELFKAMKVFHRVSCIRFRPKVTTDIDYIYITEQKPGCNSGVGRNGGKQIVNLQRKKNGVHDDKSNNSCLRLGTILHEFLHTLGFYHMQSSPERDDHIEILWDRIKRNYHHNFRTYSSGYLTNFDLPYDYDSIMHYGNKAFSVDGNITIVPKVNNTIDSIGQRKGLSIMDIEKLNIMYNCYADFD